MLAGVLIVLTACGSPSTPETPMTTTGSLSSAAVNSQTLAPAPTVTNAAWSPEAVTACRTFVNSGNPQMILLARSSLNKYRTDMTPQEISQAGTGWGLATANMSFPDRVGQDAEPEVYQALSAVSTALDFSISRGGQEAYVKVMSAAFMKAIDVCTQVGVIK
jgi:hypothetical protein